MAVDSQVRRHMPRFHSDLHEGIRQTDEQLFGKERSRTAAQQKLADQKLYNPLYWAMLLLSVPFFLLGRWVHLPCGQGDAVRDDESEMEYEIRTLWIYGSDSFFFLGLVYAGVSASWQAAHDDFEAAIDTHADEEEGGVRAFEVVVGRLPACRHSRVHEAEEEEGVAPGEG